MFCDDDEGRKGKERKGDEANALGRGDSPRAPTAQISRSERVRDVTVRYLLRGGVRDGLFVFCRLETRPKRTFDDDADDAWAEGRTGGGKARSFFPACGARPPRRKQRALDRDDVDAPVAQHSR